MLTFAAPAADVQALLPAPLVADTWQDEWAFLAVALVETHALRPKGSRLLGQDFCLVGYRAFVRYVTPAGKRLRGLYILRLRNRPPPHGAARQCVHALRLRAC
ncbi:MAG: hypothetical protein WKG07_34995 [Hymenobacter sp.]